MDLITDVSRGDWLLARAGEFGTVASVAGTRFAAYARILHPAWARREDLTKTDQWGSHPVVEEARWRWSDVATRTGITTHASVQWSTVSGADDGASASFDDGWEVSPPEIGLLAHNLLAALTEHLAAATRTPDDLVAGVWEGWGDLNGYSAVGFGWVPDPSGADPTEDELTAQLAETRRLAAEHRAAQEAVLAAIAGPRLAWPGREFFLLPATIGALADRSWYDDIRTGDQDHTPQLLWPEDHAWVVASEIDCDSTIVAGSRDLIDAVLADERLESFEVGPDSPLA